MEYKTYRCRILRWEDDCRARLLFQSLPRIDQEVEVSACRIDSAAERAASWWLDQEAEVYTLAPNFSQGISFSLYVSVEKNNDWVTYCIRYQFGLEQMMRPSKCQRAPL